MRLHHRITAFILIFIFVICISAQAAGTEYTATDPVLYVDEKPVFILEDLSIRAGVRDDDGRGVTWLDVYAGDSLALTSSMGIDATGIFAALGGIPSAYGVSGSSLALLTGTGSSDEAYAEFTAANFFRGIRAYIDTLLEPMDDGTRTSESVPLNSGEAQFAMKGVSGTADEEAFTTSISASPALMAIYSTLQAFGVSKPETGTWNITGSCGSAGEGENESLLWRIRAESGEKAYDAEIIVDKSTSAPAVTFKLSGSDAEINLWANIIPDTMVSVVTDGHIGDLWFETEARSEPGIFRLGSGSYDDETDTITSVTAICEGSDFYYAISSDDGKAETCVYIFSDTAADDSGNRTGTVTAGLYDSTGRVELVSDLAVVSGDDVGALRKVDANYATEIFTVDAQALSGIKENIVNVINGAMYVISLHVPGFTYDPIDSLDFSEFFSAPAE